MKKNKTNGTGLFIKWFNINGHTMRSAADFINNEINNSPYINKTKITHTHIQAWLSGTKPTKGAVPVIINEIIGATESDWVE